MTNGDKYRPIDKAKEQKVQLGKSADYTRQIDAARKQEKAADIRARMLEKLERKKDPVFMKFQKEYDAKYGIGNKPIEHWLGEYANFLEKQGAKRQLKELNQFAEQLLHAKFPEKEEAKVNQQLHRLDISDRQSQGKLTEAKEKSRLGEQSPSRADYTRQIDAARKQLEVRISADEIKERERVYHPPDGVGCRFGDNKPAPGEMDRYLNNLSSLDRLQLLRGSSEIAIVGYASRPGASDFNQKLSEKRAESVKKILVEQYGIDPSRIKTFGKGEGGLEVLDSPNQDNHQERWVEIRFDQAAEKLKESIETTKGDAERIAGRLVEPFPSVNNPDQWKEYALETLKNLLPLLKDSLKGSPEIGVLKSIGKFAFSSFKDWIESAAKGRENWATSANFIPAFLGEIERLTTHTQSIHPYNYDSQVAVLGAYYADMHFVNLPKIERQKLVHLMQDSTKRERLLQQLGVGLRTKLIHK